MNSAVVIFNSGQLHVELNCPIFIQRMTLEKLKKVFELMCRDHWRNTEAISQTERCLQLCKEEAHSAWNKASTKYHCDYEDVSFRYDLSTAQKKCIERENKKLINTVKSEKHQYERILKIIKLFSETKHKYSV